MCNIINSLLQLTVLEKINYYNSNNILLLFCEYKLAVNCNKFFKYLKIAIEKYLTVYNNKDKIYYVGKNISNKKHIYILFEH